MFIFDLDLSSKEIQMNQNLTLIIMKKILQLFVLICCVIFSSQKVNAQEILNLYNNTSEKIWACYATYDKVHQCWTSHGWYEIDPYKDRAILLGNYRGKAYIHAHREGFWTVNNWGKGYSLCIDPHNAFEIRFADKANCEHRAEFSEITISAGRNDHTFNP